jgi:hypothetical protein
MINDGQLMMRVSIVSHQLVQQGAAIILGILTRSLFRTHSIRTTPAPINSSNSQTLRSFRTNCSSRRAEMSLMSKTDQQLPLNPNNKILLVVLDRPLAGDVILELAGSSVEPNPIEMLGLSW